MRATFFGIELGKRAILTQRTSMDVTSQNIANANTEGYSRQRAVLAATESWSPPGFYAPTTAQQVGSGVDVEKIVSLRDAFIDQKITKESSTLEQRTTADSLLKEVEAIFNEPNDATLRDNLDKFWAAWEDLSVNPTNSSLRGNLVANSENLIAGFQDIDLRLRRLQGTPDYAYQGSIENQIEDSLKQVNSQAHQIAELNLQIERTELGGGRANDLRDKRQKLMEELAQNINVECSYDSKGMLSIRSGSHMLVEKAAVNELHYTRKVNDSPGSITSDENYPEVSEKPDIATAVLTHTANNLNITINIETLAQADARHSYLSFLPEGNPLSSFGVSSGSFSLNGKQFYIDAENSTLKDLAAMINQGNINVDASVTEGGRLVIKSTLTGTKNALVTNDQTSNIFAILNLQTETAAQDARFNIGNQQFVTSENVVTEAYPGTTLYLNKVGVVNLDLRPVVTGGKLKALMEVRDGNIKELRDKLDEMAFTLVTEVNAAHRLGFGLDGQTGRNFFKAQTSDDPSRPFKDAMRNLDLDESIKSNLNAIAASQGSLLNPTDKLPTYNGEGDGKNAISIAQIKQRAIFNDGKANFNDLYNEIVTKVATDSQRAGMQMNSSADLMTQLDSKREEISGVSLDEEMTNLIKFQQAYNAAARIVTTVNDMLDTIINGMLR